MAHSSPFAGRLASNIVKEHFGPTCEAVCSSLILKGVQTLREVGRSTGLRVGEAQSALLVLLQQNCVVAYLTQDDAHFESGAVRSEYQYDVDLPAILQSLRKPRILLHVRDEVRQAPPAAPDGLLDDDDEDTPSPGQAEEANALAECIVEVLLENSRLRFEQVVNGVASKQEAAAEEVREAVRSVFVGLVREHYVEQAPSCRMPRPRKQAKAGPKAKRAAPKAGTSDKAEAEAFAAARESAAAADYAARRYDWGSLRDSSTQNGAKPAAAPSSRKRKAGAAASEPSPKSTAPPVLWRVSLDEFNRRFRHSTCVQMVHDKHGKAAATALNAILAATRQYETEVAPVRSAPASEAQIMQALRRIQRNEPDDSEPSNEAGLRDALRDLCQDGAEIVSDMGPAGVGGRQYCANMKRIIDITRIKHLESSISAQFGQKGLRIFRLLQDIGQLEQKQVAEKAMLPMKDVRELLYRMLRAGYISLQGIPRTADHAPSRTFYTFRASELDACSRMAANLFQAALNVRLRLQHEMLQEKEVLDLLESGAISSDTMNAAQARSIERVKRVSALLVAQMLSLDEDIALFNDF